MQALDDSPEEQPSVSPPLEPSISSDDSASEYNKIVLDNVYEDDSWSSDSDNYIVCYPQPYTILYFFSMSNCDIEVSESGFSLFKIHLFIFLIKHFF